MDFWNNFCALEVRKEKISGQLDLSGPRNCAQNWGISHTFVNPYSSAITLVLCVFSNQKPSYGCAKMVTIRRFLPNLSLLAGFSLSMYKCAKLWPGINIFFNSKALGSKLWLCKEGTLQMIFGPSTGSGQKTQPRDHRAETAEDF